MGEALEPPLLLRGEGAAAERAAAATIAPHRRVPARMGAETPQRDVLGHHAGRDRVGAPERGVVVNAGRAPAARHLGRRPVALLREPRADRGRREPKLPTVTIASSSKRTTWAPSAPIRRTASSATRATTESGGAACATASAARRSAAWSSAIAALAAAASRSRSWSRRCAVASRSVSRHLGGRQAHHLAVNPLRGPAGHARPGLVAARLTVGQRPGAHLRERLRDDGGDRLAQAGARRAPPATRAPARSGRPGRSRRPRPEGVTAWSTTTASRLAASAAARRASPVSDVSILPPSERHLTLGGFVRERAVRVRYTPASAPRRNSALMAHISLNAQERTEFGDGPARRLRRQGLVPGVVYQPGGPSLALSLPDRELRRALAEGRTAVIDLTDRRVRGAPGAPEGLAPPPGAGQRPARRLPGGRPDGRGGGPGGRAARGRPRRRQGGRGARPDPARGRRARPAGHAAGPPRDRRQRAGHRIVHERRRHHRPRGRHHRDRARGRGGVGRGPERRGRAGAGGGRRRSSSRARSPPSGPRTTTPPTSRTPESMAGDEAPPPIRLVAGLGNPEPRYSGTRHNAGQMVVDVLASRLGADPVHRPLRRPPGRGARALGTGGAAGAADLHERVGPLGGSGGGRAARRARAGAGRARRDRPAVRDRSGQGRRRGRRAQRAAVGDAGAGHGRVPASAAGRGQAARRSSAATAPTGCSPASRSRARRWRR